MTETILGAVIGASTTLLAVVITNHYQSKSQKEDREYSLKSELYMAAAEELMSSKMLLMKLPNISQEQLNKETDNKVATAKLTIIATNETVQAVTALSVAIAEKFLLLLPDRQPLESLRTSIKILSNQLDGSFQKQNQMLNEMTAFNLRGDNDTRFWQKLQDNFAYHSEQIDKLINERDEKYNELNEKMKDFFIKCMKASISLSELEIKAISSVRKELNMPFDEEKYRGTIVANNTKMEEEFNKFFENLSS